MFSIISFRRIAAVFVVGCLLVTWLSMPALAQRPAAPKLLPKNTLAYVRVADSRVLVEDFMATSIGRLSRDEQIKPLIMQLYGSAAQAFDQLQEEVGLSLDQILAIPQGEICFAVVGREFDTPGVVGFMEVGDQMPNVQELLKRAENAAMADGASKDTEKADGATITTLNDDVSFCTREGVVFIGSDAVVIKDMLERWTLGEGAEGVETFADNRMFTAIMRRSVGTKDERPHMTFFVDPIELFKNATMGNPGAQIAAATFPALGLNGIKAAGGSFVFNTEEFDSISYLHLMLDNPREGIMEMLAMESGDVDPEDWVPFDAALYMTVHWDAEESLQALRKIFDKLRGEGSFDTMLDAGPNQALGIDFEKDLLAQIEGRLTYVQWMEKPAKINSGTNLVGIKLKDPAAFEKTLLKIFERTNAEIPRKSFRGESYYEFPVGGRRDRMSDEEVALVRMPTPAMAFVGDYVIASDSLECIKAAISSKSDPSKSLGDELDFKLIKSRIQQRLGSTRPGMITFQRPEETMRTFYDLATAPNTRQMLAGAADTNPGLRALHEALEQNPLPPFSVIAKYLAPAGGMTVNDQSGFHYTTFSLKRE